MTVEELGTVGCPTGELVLLDFGLLRLWAGAPPETPDGPWAVGVGGVPRGRPLPVRGRRMDPGGLDSRRWHDVWVELGPAEPVSSQQVGTVLVDGGRLLLADFAALRAWDDGHDRLLAPAHGSPTGSATVEVGGSAATGFLTTWGDGTFAVHADLGADGLACRFRVELGAPDTIRRARRLDELWLGDLAKIAIASARIASDGRPVGSLYREAPGHQDDSGWRLFAGDETEDYLDDPDNAVIVRLSDLVKADADLEPVLRTPAPAAYGRSPDGAFVALDPPPG